MNVLVVDDDEMITALVKFLLEEDGFSVSVASSPESAFSLLNRQAYHVLLLDILFGTDAGGLDLCRKLREDKHDIPLIFLTGKDGTADRVAGLRAGADDYISKPFDPNELVARVHAVFRRYSHEQRNNPVLEGCLKLNMQELTVTTPEGRDISLTPTEMRILRHLLINAGHTVSRESLLASIWGSDYDCDSNPVDVYIRRLRKKIESEPSRPALLLTVRGAGYKLLA